MDGVLYIPILAGVIIPALMLLLVHSQRVHTIRRRVRRRRRSKRRDDSATAEEVPRMTNELIRSLIGKVCQISTGSLGESFDKVEVVSVVDNWMEVRRKDKTRLINTDYITSVKVLSDAGGAASAGGAE
jgi:hypothetical protein